MKILYKKKNDENSRYTHTHFINPFSIPGSMKFRKNSTF